MVTSLLENETAQLVETACDEDAIELVVFPPALCYKMGFPHCTIKGKAGLDACPREDMRDHCLPAH